MLNLLPVISLPEAKLEPPSNMLNLSLTIDTRGHAWSRRGKRTQQQEQTRWALY